MGGTKRRHSAALGSLTAASATTIWLSVLAAAPAGAVNGSLEFCPYLPYLAKGGSQLVQSDYSWTLSQVDPAGHSTVQQQGRDRGCHVVSPVGNAAYTVGVQTDCITIDAGSFRLTGTSPTVWVPEGPGQARTRVDAGWSKC